jgi:(hydroxyamino)benzene mutase
VNRVLVRHGVILALLSSLSGFAPLVVRNPRMGLAAHVAGLMSALLLLALGAAWAAVKLSPGKERLAAVLLLWTAYGNWAITLVASMTGAKQFAPQAGEGFGASAAVEKATLLLILTVAVSTLAGLGLVLSGLRRRESSAPGT